jgi:tetratricopeptide (TPR) repeat protein
MFASLVNAPQVNAQDAVYKYKAGGGTSKVNGKISEVTPDGVTIGGKQIPASEVKRVYYSKETSGLNRAREQMQDGRFSDAIEELEKIDAGDLQGPLKVEADFVRAYSTSQLSLRGGNVTAQVAGNGIRKFITTHSKSLHLYPAIDQYGKLLFSVGRPKLAAAEFAKLANCSWPEYRMQGLFQLGKSSIEAGDLPQATSAFDQILAIDSNDDLSRTYKLMAQCEKARLAGLAGNVEPAVATLNQLIDVENSDNKLLFAHLYNAKGAVQEKAGKLKEASRAYLLSHLLYSTVPEAHSEALYRLALIWPQLEETDRANEARETLKTRYRNSYWAGKL